MSTTDEYTTTAVHLPKEQLRLLRRVAIRLAEEEGGRASVSAVIRDLIEWRRPDLERLAAPTVAEPALSIPLSKLADAIVRAIASR